MCGDGTNDVGALKQAHVGVALLNAPVGKTKKKKSRSTEKVASRSKDHSSRKSSEKDRNTTERRRPNKPATLADLMKELEDSEVGVVQLGDASIASPFTSKSSAVMPGFVCLWMT